MNAANPINPLANQPLLIEAVKAKTKSKKTDVIIGYCQRGTFAKEVLKINPATLYEWDAILSQVCLSYRQARLGSRQPLSIYQQWCLTRFKELMQATQVRSYKAIKRIITENPDILSYESFESDRVKQANQHSSQEY